MITMGLLLSFVFNTSVSAVEIYDPPSESFSTCADHYFSKIGAVPENVNGSCVYVALSMILSFYDTYWSDMFVEENFENDSIRPGSGVHITYPTGAYKIKLENSLIGEDVATDVYADFIRDNYADYLHPYLIYIASTEYEDGDWEGFLDLNEDTYGTNDQNAIELLEYYLYQIAGFAETQISVNYMESTGTISSNSAVYQKMYELVSDGTPVYYSASNSTNTSSHAMVAYAIGEDGNIKLHIGSAGNYVDDLLSCEYNSNPGIIWLQIDNTLPHSCCDHFSWFDGGNVCSCVAYKDLHPAHHHINSNQLVSFDDEKHVYKCIYGDLIEESHSRKNCTSVSNSLHSFTCCGETFYESHSMLKVSLTTFKCVSCNYTRELDDDNGMVHLGAEEEKDKE